VASTTSPLHIKQELKKSPLSTSLEKNQNFKRNLLTTDRNCCESRVLLAKKNFYMKKRLSLHTHSLVSRVKKRPKGTSNRYCSNDNIR